MVPKSQGDEFPSSAAAYGKRPIILGKKGALFVIVPTALRPQRDAVDRPDISVFR
jgi:hypothetical protein